MAWSQGAFTGTSNSFNTASSGSIISPTDWNDTYSELVTGVLKAATGINSYGSTDVASSGTTDIGAAATAAVRITGTTTITSFGTATSTRKLILFAGALTLTHNATSLILPGAVSIITTAGDCAEAVSDSSGNWRVVRYMRTTGDIPSAHYISLTADYTLTDSNSAQKAFNSSTNGAVTLAASTAYYVEGQFLITNTGTTSHTWGFLFGGTATITAAGTALVASGYTATSNALTAPSTIYITGAGVSSVTVMTTASTSATENVVIEFRGRINVNAAGTLIPQVKLSAATTGTATMLAGSYFRCVPLGTNTVTTVGNWS